MTDLNVIQPEATSATFNGKQITIEPLKVGQLPAFVRAIKPISGQIAAMATGGAKPDMFTIMDMVGSHGDNVIEAVSIASGVPVEELKGATLDQLIDLGFAAFKVNADFFKGRLTPAILAATKQIMPAQQAAGLGQTR
jgi:hypothetical protein